MRIQRKRQLDKAIRMVMIYVAKNIRLRWEPDYDPKRNQELLEQAKSIGVLINLMFERSVENEQTHHHR